MSPCTDPINPTQIYKIQAFDESFFLVGAVAMKTDKLYFTISMTNIAKEKNFFLKIIQFINPNYPWKNRVKQISDSEDIVS